MDFPSTVICKKNVQQAQDWKMVLMHYTVAATGGVLQKSYSWRTAGSSKRHYNTGVFLWILPNF